jgi:dihydrofolate reductase
MKLSLIAAVADNRVIGQGNDIPWRLPEDWKRFKATTMGHHLLMGRRTWESIGRALPGRTTVVITRGDLDLPAAVASAASLDAAIEHARAAGDNEAFIAGGAEIYRQSLDRVDRLYLTRVHASPDGDTFFPDWDRQDWTVVSSERHEPDDRHTWAYTFELLERARR